MVANADAFDRGGIGFGEEFTYDATQTAGDLGFFYSYDTFALFGD